MNSLNLKMVVESVVQGYTTYFRYKNFAGHIIFSYYDKILQLYVIIY